MIGARQDSPMRRLLGILSAKVAAEALYTVTVVRPNLTTEEENAAVAVSEASSAGQQLGGR